MLNTWNFQFHEEIEYRGNFEFKGRLIMKENTVWPIACLVIEVIIIHTYLPVANSTVEIDDLLSNSINPYFNELVRSCFLYDIGILFIKKRKLLMQALFFVCSKVYLCFIYGRRMFCWAEVFVSKNVNVSVLSPLTF